jgi:hypothetical protein
MRIRRNISSIPLRSASETWDRIIELVTGPGSKDVQQLTAASSVIASVITDELPADCPFLFEGCGPQLRIYCLYAIKALAAGNSVDSIAWNPTAGDWALHVPCDIENLEWVRKALAETSPRIKVFDVAEADRADQEVEKAAATSSDAIIIDWNLKD